MVDEALRKQILVHLAAGEMIRGVLAVRQQTGADLRTARDIVEEIRQTALPLELPGEEPVGMAAQVLAIGPFSPDIVSYLPYPPELYASTKIGAPVLTYVFEAWQGSTMSRELAACFGIDPWDFSQHKLDPAKADEARLRQSFDGEFVTAFRALRERGFDFYFIPNG